MMPTRGEGEEEKSNLYSGGERKVVEMPSGSFLDVCRVGASVGSFVMNWSRNEGDIRPFL